MLFVYGTLQDPDVLAAVLGRPVDVAVLPVAAAPGYRAIAYPGRVYPALVADPTGAAPGRLLAGLDRLDFDILDAFEGDEYRRTSITVVAAEQSFAAAAYLPAAVIANAGPAWSLAHWTLRHKAAVLGSETGTATALRQRLTCR